MPVRHKKYGDKTWTKGTIFQTPEYRKQMSKNTTKKVAAKTASTATLQQPTRRSVEKLLKNLCSGRHDWCERSDDPLKERRDNVHHDVVALERELQKRYVEHNPKVQALKALLSVANSVYELAKGEIAVRALTVQEKYQAQGLTPEVMKDMKELVDFAHNYRANLLKFTDGPLTAEQVQAIGARILKTKVKRGRK